MICSTLPTADPEFRKIVEEFADRLRSQIEGMVAAWSVGDLDRLAALAHWIKGSGGTAGFGVLTGPARSLETAVREKRMQEIPEIISQLQDLACRIGGSPESPSTALGDEPMSRGVAA
jgi:HPt (histidine-containing phosphotransfer) domain-containing protein